MKTQTLTKDERQVETLLQAYQSQKAARNAADNELRRITEALQSLATRHPEWFASKQTRAFAHGKLAWTTRNEVNLPEPFDLPAFYTMFPQAVRLAPSLSGIQQLQADAAAARALEQLGVHIRPSKLFAVKL